VFVIQNAASGQGGGIYNAGTELLPTNTTIADNHPSNCVDNGGTGCP
jgi:predicted outer membrane repeat protein